MIGSLMVVNTSEESHLGIEKILSRLSQVSPENLKASAPMDMEEWVPAWGWNGMGGMGGMGGGMVGGGAVCSREEWSNAVAAMSSTAASGGKHAEGICCFSPLEVE